MLIWMSSENVSVESGSSVGRRKPVIFLAILLAAGVLLTFLPATRNGFVNYDDPDYVTANAHVQRGLSWENFSWALRTNYASNWHPVTWLSHMLDCTLFGQNAAGHHATSIFLHAITTAFVFLLFWKMTGATGRSLVLAALFGLHPLRVESVAWICERKDVLAAFFGVLTLGFYVLWVERVRGGTRKAAIYYGAAIVCYALGLMSKSMLVSLPFVMLLLDYWPLRRWRFSIQNTNARRLITEKLSFFVLAVVVSAITLVVQKNAGAVKTMASYPVVTRWENAAISYCRYLGKFFCPVDLAAFYPHPVYWPLVSVTFAVCLLLWISFLALRSRHTHPYFLVGWLWFLGTAVPVIGLVQVGAQSMADRYTYIPSIGATIVLVWGIYDLTKDRLWLKRVLPLATIFILGTSAILTRKQIGYWHNSETLFRHAIAATGKNPVAHMNLGVALLDQNRSKEGLRELKTAVELAPHYAEAHLTFATALEKTGQYDAAITELDEVIRLNPQSAKAYFEAGVVLDKTGHPSESAHFFEEAIKRDSTFAEAHRNLGVELEKAAQPERAIAEYSEALRLDPNYVEAHQSLGALLFNSGRIEKARLHFARALELEPGSAVAHNDMAGALFVLGRVDDAVAQYKEALRLKPDFTEARTNLNGVLQAKQTGDRP